ncbi:hypothetical protein [Streptosporangium sandarakinum]|uniref:hypothetical protein n=1 Tax=Streptosporangium sandarakinum TaxID=1260955 RepID=UPI0033A54A9B
MPVHVGQRLLDHTAGGAFSGGPERARLALVVAVDRDAQRPGLVEQPVQVGRRGLRIAYGVLRAQHAQHLAQVALCAFTGVGTAHAVSPAPALPAPTGGSSACTRRASAGRCWTDRRTPTPR